MVVSHIQNEESILLYTTVPVTHTIKQQSQYTWWYRTHEWRINITEYMMVPHTENEESKSQNTWWYHVHRMTDQLHSIHDYTTHTERRRINIQYAWWYHTHRRINITAYMMVPHTEWCINFIVYMMIPHTQKEEESIISLHDGTTHTGESTSQNTWWYHAYKMKNQHHYIHT